MSDNYVITERMGNVLHVQMNRPDKKNALTHAMYSSMNDALEELENDKDLRVLFLTGTKDCFTAGNDMVDFMNNPPKGTGFPVSIFLEKILNAKKPIVAAINGSAVGVGVTMLLHFDLVYAGEDAKLQMPFVSLGLCPEAGSSYIIPQMIGHRKAAELLLLSETFDAHEAKDYGIVNQVFSNEDYQEKALEKAKQLAAQPASSVRLTKSLMKENNDKVAESLMKEGAEFMQRLGSPEAQEAMSAFMQKRAPDFSKFD